MAKGKRGFLPGDLQDQPQAAWEYSKAKGRMKGFHRSKGAASPCRVLSKEEIAALELKLDNPR